MQTYLERKGDKHLASQIITYLTLGLALISFVAAGLILTGWIPLGERANILRNNYNWVEWSAMAILVVYGIASLRTFRGLLQREHSSLAWIRWLSFITIFVGVGFVASVVIPGYAKALKLGTSEGPAPIELQMFFAGIFILLLGLLGIIYNISARAGLLGHSLGNYIGQRTRDSSSLIQISVRNSVIVFVVGIIIATIGNIIWVTRPEFSGSVGNVRNPEIFRLIPGLILLLVALWVYRYVRKGEEESDELRRAVSLTPGKYIRTLLAKSPSAGALIGFFAIFMGFIMATDLFLTPTSIGSVLTNVSSKGVMAIGVTILMISGEFDLSVGSILGVVAMAFMAFMTEGAPIFGVMDPLPAAILALVVAALLGIINGFILVTTGIPSFIVTLGTMLAYRAITLVGIAGGRILRYRDYFDEFPQTFVSPWFILALSVIGLLIILYTAYRTVPVMWERFTRNWEIRAENGDFGTTMAIVSGVFVAIVTVVLFFAGLWMAVTATAHIGGDLRQVGFFEIVNGRWDGGMLLGQQGLVIGGIELFQFDVPGNANFRLAIIWWLIFTIIFNIILTSTRYGNSVFAVGGNVGAARAQGINVPFVKVMNFMLTAVLTGVAAIYEVARNPGVDPLKGDQFELEVIAMTVIGGSLLTGGYGSIIGSLFGALIVGMLQTGLVLVGIESRLFEGTVGIVIIVAVVLNTAVRGIQRN